MSGSSPVSRLIIRALFAGTATGFLLQRRPSGYPRSRRTGPDPIRVLIVGAGLAIGYGVRSMDDSLNGQLATALSKQLGRGVVVETIAAPAMPLGRTIHRLGANGAHTFRAVVYVPNLLEVTRGESRRWGTQLRDLITHLQQTGGSSTRIVLAGLPVPEYPRRTERVVAAQVVGTNRHMAEIASEIPGVEFAATPPMLTFRGKRSFDAEFYTRTAECISAVLVPMLAANHHDDALR